MAKVESKVKESPPKAGKTKVEGTKTGGSSKTKVMELIEKMSVLELSELVHELEEKFGVSAAPVAVQSGGVPSQVETATTAEEKTEFDVVLKSFGENKIRVIKAVREVTELGLKEAKDLVDGAPGVVKEKILKGEAEGIAKKLQDAGAVCEIK